MKDRRTPHPAPADPSYAEFIPTPGWPVVYRDCDGTCGKAHQAHEDHGDGTYLCHNCGHPPRA